MLATDGPIWDALRAKAPGNVAQIEGLAADAAALLGLVQRTFPTYTLHESQHAENVLRLMGDLLGPEANELTGLEAAMLILSAYFHDIGMVYTPEERDALRSSEEFAKFLESRPEAYLAVQRNAGAAPEDVLLDFCRAHHGEHARALLNGMSGKLRWGIMPLAPALADLCASHSLPAAHLKEDSFRVDFLDECDLRMCGILLRLADILDFDASRSPQAVYEHLRLAEHASAQIALSDAEWRKHLRSEGFTFPPNREHAYLVKIKAAPDEPSVEAGMRQFLAAIERELDACRAILSFCSARWAEISLPAGIDRSHIASDGYIYGDFTFRLDRSEILELFMGERLYDNPYVFIRELIQNSIDATRLRKALHPGQEFDDAIDVSTWKDPSGFLWIRIDDSGVGMDEEILREYFLRVGKSYYRSAEVKADLLRAGARARGGFAAISRFGVGILSCFTVADKVEVSTRRLYRDGKIAQPLRLSISNAEDFFTLRRGPMPVASMPNQANSVDHYRRKPGTSIALRVNPARANIDARVVRQQMERFVMCPPVKVRYNDAVVEAMASSLLDFPIIPEPVLTELNNDKNRSIDVGVSYRDFPGFTSLATGYIGSVKLAAIPLQIQYQCDAGSIRGQLLIYMADAPDLISARRLDLKAGTVNNVYKAGMEDLLRAVPQSKKKKLPPDLVRRLSTAVQAISIGFSALGQGTPRLQILVSITQSDARALLQIIGSAPIAETVLPGLEDIISHIASKDNLGEESIAVKLKAPPGDSLERFQKNGTSSISWCHNGISVPTPRGERSLATSTSSGLLTLNIPEDMAMAGVLSFSDGLRPDVSVARDQTIAVPFELHSALQLSVRRAILAYADGNFKNHVERFAAISLISVLPAQANRMMEAMNDDSILANDGWPRERLIPAAALSFSGQGKPTEPDHYTVADLRAKSPRETMEIMLEIIPGRPWLKPEGRSQSSKANFYQFLTCTLVQMYLDVCVSFFTEENGDNIHRRQRLIVRSPSVPYLPRGLGYFPPLFFVPYEDDFVTLKDSASTSVNANHPLAQWLIGQAELLDRDAPVLLARLIDALKATPSGYVTYQVNRLLNDLRVVLPALMPTDHTRVRFEDGKWI